MRRMSFMLTTRQLLERSKTVTRRLGWEFLKPGEVLLAVDKCMGLKPGQVSQTLATIQVISATRVSLDKIDALDVAREGFPGMEPEAFVAMFCKHMKCAPDTPVTRIEFRYVVPMPREERTE